MVSTNIVKMRKNLIILLAILFSSAIFSTSSSIIYSIDNFNQYLYGNENDIIVIYDRSAETPFTSDVPAAYNAHLNTIDGVLLTSPELVIPGVYNNYSLLMRAANFTALKIIEHLKLISGTNLNDNDKASVVIGQVLADRLHLRTGQEIIFRGSLKNNAVLLRVKGIFSGPAELEDEMVTTLNVGHKLSVHENVYNHIKVKFNTTETSASEILKVVTSLYDNKISLLYKNATQTMDKYDLQVIDSNNNDVLYNESIVQSADVALPFGEYEFIFSENRSVLLSETRFIQSDGNQTFAINDFEYNTTISFLSAYPNNVITYEIFNQTNYRVFNGLIKQNEKFSQILKQGEYKFRFSTPENSVEFTRTVDKISNFEFPLSDLRYTPKIYGLNNNTQINAESGRFYLTNIIASEGYKVFVDNTNQSFQNFSFDYNLLPGQHKIEIKNTNDVILSTTTFEITTSKPTNLDLSNFANYSRFEINTPLNLNSNIPIENILNITRNSEKVAFNTGSSTNEIIVNSGPNNGIKVFTVNYVDFSFKVKQFSFIVFNEQNPNFAGLASINNQFVENSFVKIWYKGTIPSITINNQLLQSEGNNNFRLPNSLTGSQEITINNGSRQVIIPINISPLNSMIIFSDGNSNLPTINGTLVSSNFLNVDYNSLIFDAYLDYNGNEMKLPNSQIFPTITNDRLTSIVFENRITKERYNYLVTISNSVTESLPGYQPLQRINPTGFLPTFYLDKISVVSKDIQTYNTNTYLVSRNNSNYLIPGIYSVNYAISGQQIKDTITVPIWHDKVTEITNLSTIYGNVTEQNGSLPKNIILSASDSYYYRGRSFTLKNYYQTLSNSYYINLPVDIIDMKLELGNSSTIYDSGMTLNVNGTTSYSAQYHSRYNTIVSSKITIKNPAMKAFEGIILRNPDNLVVNKIELFNTTLGYDLQPSQLDQAISIPNIQLFANVTTNTKTYRVRVANNSTHIFLDINQQRSLSSYDQNFNLTTSLWGRLQLVRGDAHLNIVVEGNIPNIADISTEFRLNYNNLPLELKNGQLSYLRPIEYGDAIIITKNGIGIDQGNLKIIHKYLKVEQVLQKSNANWLIKHFPLGPINVSIIRFAESIDLHESITQNNQQIIIVFDPLTEVSIDKFISLGSHISAELATDFFNQEITGPFAFFRISLIAESIIVIFLLIVNVSGVYAGVVSEHRHELRTLKSIGFTNHQLVISILRGTVLFAFPVLALGGLLGIGLSQLLLITNNTILFGHRFKPVFPHIYWLFNFLVGYLLMYVGAYIGLKLEGDTIKA